MEEQNQTNQNLKQEQQIQQEYNPMSQEQVIKNKPTFLLKAAGVILLTVFMGLYMVFLTVFTGLFNRGNYPEVMLSLIINLFIVFIGTPFVFIISIVVLMRTYNYSDLKLKFLRLIIFVVVIYIFGIGSNLLDYKAYDLQQEGYKKDRIKINQEYLEANKFKSSDYPNMSSCDNAIGKLYDDAWINKIWLKCIENNLKTEADLNLCIIQEEKYLKLESPTLLNKVWGFHCYPAYALATYDISKCDLSTDINIRNSCIDKFKRDQEK